MRQRGKARKGGLWLRQVLIVTAHAAAKTKRTCLAALFHRLVGRRGNKKKAVRTVGHAILVIVHRLLTPNVAYSELGPYCFDARERQKVERRLVQLLKELGCEVQLQPGARPA